jgi:hypothetical protein
MGPTDCSQNAGCTVLENKSNSFGQGLNQNGGGVYAAQFDISGFVQFMFPVVYRLTSYPVAFCEIPYHHFSELS